MFHYAILDGLEVRFRTESVNAQREPRQSLYELQHVVYAAHKPELHHQCCRCAPSAVCGEVDLVGAVVISETDAPREFSRRVPNGRELPFVVPLRMRRR